MTLSAHGRMHEYGGGFWGATSHVPCVSARSSLE
eukprot:CAMPEP_0197913532 /NCGR_PEP_ID=MMETSP1439-20131203/76807_1 /TAXON_ID=66791 /ORGANISM="Gonyaulax spinifera, Strain CCMP409" /LENGTH=33 /DNA_ID= /DNA_START= /DNA_END= /DNA_ORIENTATION=